MDIIRELKALKPDEPDEEIAKDVAELKRQNPSVTDDQILEQAKVMVGGGKPTFGAPTPPAAPGIPPMIARPPEDPAAAPAAPPPPPPTPPTGGEPPIDAPEKLGGRDVMMAALQGLAGIGDTMSNAYGGQKTNFLASAMGAEKSARDDRASRRKELADALARKKAEERAAAAEGREVAQEGRAATAFDRTQAENKEKDDPASPVSKEYQALAGRMIPGRDFSGISASQLERALPPIVKMYEIEQGRTAKTEKLEAEKKAKVIPGFDTAGDVQIDETEARKLREGVAEFNTFREGLRQYQDLIRKHGTTEILDRGAAAEMDAMAKNLQLKVKNLAQLGVLSASDIPFIEKQIPAPGLLKTQGGMEGALKATNETMTRSILNTLAARGYQPTAEFRQSLQDMTAGAPAGAPSAGGLAPDKAARLAELRKKRDAGTLQ